ncbi:P-loop NTPase family protein [Aneurinibacillus aneurinilyticus]|uniref:DNA replication protein n=1 Tax=Aneurinibacillus aneurinilyticus TaxID=1391 RepID=UPI00367184B3
MTHASKCVLSTQCTIAGTVACNRLCAHYIALHGATGEGGRHGYAGIPEEYRFVTVQNSPVRETQPKAYESIDAYVSTFTRQFTDVREAMIADGHSENKVRMKSLYLYSDSPGTGKTTTAAVVLNAYLTTAYIGAIQRGLQPEQRPALFFDVNEWQGEYNEFNRPRVPESIAGPAAERYYNALQAAKSVPFLVLDDIGVRDATDGFRSDLHRIVNERVTNGLPTLYTSNVTIDALESVFDRRLADRVRDMCVVVPFKGESKRGIRK